jgi:tRNA(Ile)-lysidine synthase
MSQDAATAVYRAVRTSAQSTEGPLLLAVSGGLDSMALLEAMAREAPRRIAAVATFDHGTGSAATAAVELVRERCKRLGLRFVSDRMPAIDAMPDGREAAWRAARMTFLLGLARDFGAHVVTAHTEDDQLETILLRIMRGSGARGLAGLYAPSAVIRPFLALRRRTLKAFAEREGMRWLEDPSNASRAFTRNRARHDLLPALRVAAPDLDASLLALARRSQELRGEVEAFVTSHVRPVVDSRGRLVVVSRELAGYDRESLALLWGALAGRIGLALDWRGTRRLAAFTISHPRAGSIQLAGGWCLEATPDAYIIERAATPATLEAVVLPGGGTMEWGSFRFRVCSSDQPGSPWTATIADGAGVTVRTWSPGDRLSPAGGQQRRRVKRYLSEAGVQGRDRAGWPVVVAGEEVVWIPGVRRSDAATDRSGRPARHYVCERIDR